MSCPNPVTGVSLSDCTAIYAAATTLPGDLYNYTYSAPRGELVTSVTDLPPQLRDALNGCPLPGCKAVSYDFSKDPDPLISVPRKLADVPFITGTKMTSQANSAVILKDGVNPQPPVMSGLQGYEFFSTPFEIRNLTNGGYIHVEYPGVPTTGNSLYDCAEKCDQGSDCAGFNFRSSVGTCTFLPTGAATSSSTQATYASDEWVKTFDSSSQGMAYRKKPTIRVNVNDTIPAYINLSATHRFCNNSLACNTVISNVLTIGTLTQFDTSDFEQCYRCPGKQYRTSGSTVHTVTNEMGLAKTFGTQQQAKDALLYKPGGSDASHSVADFGTGRVVTIKKLDGTTLFSNFNSNVNGTRTVSAGWKNAKNESRIIFYDPVDYITNGYIITDMKSFEHYVPGNGTWIKELGPKYSSSYTSNVVAIT